MIWLCYDGQRLAGHLCLSSPCSIPPWPPGDFKHFSDTQNGLIRGLFLHRENLLAYSPGLC